MERSLPRPGAGSRSPSPESQNPELPAMNTPPGGPASHPEGATVRVGICAMEKKTGGKPMKQILKRLEAFVTSTALPEFEFIIWTDQMTLHEPVENWPLCDCLLSWFSDGFPAST